MVKNRLNKYLKSEKGSAIVFVVMVSLILSIVGVSLLGIVVSANMSSSVLMRANEKYFYLDNVQETILSANDGNLALAYSYADYYIADGIYEGVEAVSLIDESTPEISLNFIGFLNSRYESEIVPLEGEETYDLQLLEFQKEARDILYFYLVEKLISNSSGTMIVEDASNNDLSIEYLQSFVRTKTYGNITESSNWENYIPDDEIFILYTNVSDSNYEIDAQVNIKKPVIESYNGLNIIRRYRIKKWLFSKS